MAKKLDLAPIRERLSKATPGPWEAQKEGNMGMDGPDLWCVVCLDGLIADTTSDPADAVLIAHAPSDIQALIARVEELEAENEALREGAARWKRGEVV